MASKRREHFRKTRKARLRGLKYSPTGITALACALAAAVFFAASVVQSYRMSGEGDYLVGACCLIGLVLAVGGWILGVFSMREADIRPFAPRIGFALGIVLTIVLGGMYIYGIIV